MKRATEAGIKEINLATITQANKERNEGNIIFSKTTYTTTDGQTKQVAAVDFTTNPIGYEFNDVNFGKLATSEEGTKSLIISNQNGATVTAGADTAQNIFNNLSSFFGRSLRVFLSAVFCLGIFLDGACAYPDFWPADASVSEFIKSRTKLDITKKNLISELIARHKLDPVNKIKDQCELMNRIAEYVQLTTVALGSMGAISSENSEVYITPYRIVKSEKVYQNGVFEDEDKFNSELIYLVRDGFGRPVGVSRLFTKPFAKKSGYYKILQNHRKASEGNNSLQELVFVDQKPLNSSYLKIDNCYINEIHLTVETLYLGLPARYNQ